MNFRSPSRGGWRGAGVALAIAVTLWCSIGLRAASSATSAVAPQVSLSLRDGGTGEIEAGEPLRVVVRLSAPRGAKTAIELAPTSGTWADAVQVELLAATSDTVVAKAVALGAPDSSNATLDATRIAAGTWRFPGDSTKALAAGAYRVRARLVLNAGGGWKGERRTDDVPVKLRPAGDAGSAPSSTQARLLNRAQDARLSGRLEEAATLLDGGLKNAPLDPALLLERALVAEQAGNLPAALLCFGGATRSPGKSGIGHPDAELPAIGVRLAKARGQFATANTNHTAPAWTWPPFEVISALAAAGRESGFGPSSAASSAAAKPASPPRPIAKAPTQNSTIPATPAVAAVPVPNAAASTEPLKPEGGSLVAAAELDEKQILADTNGQWAAGASAGSQYSSPNYAAPKMTGPPDVPGGGDHTSAWCPANDTKSAEWVELTFAKPVRATEVRVRQNNGPGAIVLVEVFEPNGTAHLWWEGTDSFKAPAPATLAWFGVRVSRTSYLVARVKLTLNLAAVPGWNEIDAVQLVGE